MLKPINSTLKHTERTMKEQYDFRVMRTYLPDSSVITNSRYNNFLAFNTGNTVKPPKYYSVSVNRFNQI